MFIVGETRTQISQKFGRAFSPHQKRLRRRVLASFSYCTVFRGKVFAQLWNLTHIFYFPANIPNYHFAHFQLLSTVFGCFFIPAYQPFFTSEHFEQFKLSFSWFSINFCHLMEWMPCLNRNIKTSNKNISHSKDTVVWDFQKSQTWAIIFPIWKYVNEIYRWLYIYFFCYLKDIKIEIHLTFKCDG